VQIIPCNARLLFNDKTWESKPFQKQALTYNFDVKEKYGQRLALVVKDERDSLLRRSHRWRTDMFIFWPRISVVYVGGGEEDPFKSTIIAKKWNLAEDEEDHLFDSLPPTNSFIVDLFVTHLTKTNVIKHNIVCSLKLLFFPCLCPQLVAVI
jgi:hypothetical protein